MNRRDIDWQTIGVTALSPGWVNVYRLADGSLITKPAPAVLLQEAMMQGERETRVVFTVAECGELVQADDEAYYVDTVTEQQAAIPSSRYPCNTDAPTGQPNPTRKDTADDPPAPEAVERQRPCIRPPAARRNRP